MNWPVGVGVVNLQDFVAVVVDDPDGDFAGLRWVESPAPADFLNKVTQNMISSFFHHFDSMAF